MINSNANAMGIIFPNVYDKLVPELTSDRLMASVPFASRYRMIDFLLSSMVNCGIDNIAVLVNKNYFSLLDHLGSGREWDLTRKNGGITIFPPYAENRTTISGGRVESLNGILGFLRKQKEKYVIMSDTNIAMNFDFNAVLDAHKKSGADVTAVYSKEELPESALKATEFNKGFYYTYDVDEDNRVTDLHINSQEPGVKNFGMNIYVIEKELLIKLVKEVSVTGGIYLERDILLPRINELVIKGFEYNGYIARISDMASYFNENMKLLDDQNLDALFGGNSIYTKIRDDNPTRYIGDAKAVNVMVADGCVIEGTIENSILFRGVKVEKGAVVKNCILMQDTVVGEGVSLDYVITDKRVNITDGKAVKGEESFPIYIAKGKIV